MPRRPEHLDVDTLETLAAGERPVADVVLGALEHLGGEEAPVCPTCREVLRVYTPGRIAERAGERYTEVHARKAAQVEDLEAEHRAAVRLLEELKVEGDLGRAVGKLLSPRFATAGLCIALLNEAAAAIPESPERGRKLSLLAVVVAERVDRHRYRHWPTMPADLLCASRAQLADGLRATGHLEEAERELALAEEARRRGGGDRYYQSEVELTRCRLRLAQGRAAEVREAAYRVELRAMRSGAGSEDFAWEAIRLGAEAARALDEPGHAAEELQVLAAAMRGKASWAKEHRVRLALVGALAEAERPEDAWAELAKIRLLSDASESPVAAAREAVWEAVLHGKLGRGDEGIGQLENARRVLAREGLAVEALRATLHLLTLLGESGREKAFDACVEELPELLVTGALPGWARRHLVWVLEELARSSRSRKAGAALVGGVVLDALVRGGGERRPPEPVQ